jgi:hypothetical protein
MAQKSEEVLKMLYDSFWEKHGTGPQVKDEKLTLNSLPWLFAGRIKPGPKSLVRFPEGAAIGYTIKNEPTKGRRKMKFRLWPELPKQTARHRSPRDPYL